MAESYRPPPPAHDGPVRPLTPVQQQVADLIVLGKKYEEIAATMRLRPGTVRQYVRTMAQLFPNDECLPPRMVVYVWMKQREWQRGNAA